MTSSTDSVLFDASVLIAAFNKRDVHHAKAIELVRNAKQAVITDHVFDEVLGVLDRKVGRVLAQQAGKTMFSMDMEIAFISQQGFALAWKLFCEHDNLSFTDCTSLSAKHFKLVSHIETFDKALKTAAH